MAELKGNVPVNDIETAAPTAPDATAALVPPPEAPRLHLLLDLDEAAAETLKREIGGLLRPEKRPVARRIRQVFWDTENRRIGQAGYLVGVQTAGRRRQQICREKGASPEGGRTLVERIGPLDGESIDVTRLAFLPGCDPALVGEVAGEMLVPLMGIDLARTTWRVAFDQAQVILTLEKAAVEATNGHLALLQLDLALVSGPPEALYRLARTLLGTIPYRLAEADPVQQGYRLATGSKAVSARTTALKPGMSVREGFLAIARHGAAEVRAAIRALDGDLGTEPIHQARVALRRLRSVLTVFSSVLPPLPTGQLGRALSGFARLLGEAREWDVWLEETVEPLRAALGEADPVLDDLVGAAGAERELAAAAILHAVGGRDYVFLSLALGAWFDNAIWPEEPAPEQLLLLDARLEDFARDLLRKRHRKVVRAGEGIDGATPERLHALRIEAKKLRYTAEFLRDLFPVKPTRNYLAQLKAIQEILGAANDAVVARRLVPHLTTADDAAAARAAGLIAGWTAAEATGARRRFAEAWREFQDAKRFWKE
jgi:CHAD domain-containing protein